MADFFIAFKCANCGKEWKEEFERGDRVVTGSYPHSLYLKSHAHTVHSPSRNWGCTACRHIKCPQCDSTEDVFVTKRSPIPEELTVELTDGSELKLQMS